MPAGQLPADVSKSYAHMRAYRALLAAERKYLELSGWWKDVVKMWVDPRNPRRSHVQRVAVNIQKLRESR